MLSARAPSVSCNERWARCFAQRRGPFLPVLGVSFIRAFPRSHRGILTKPIAASSASMVLSRTRIPCARLPTEIWFAFLAEIVLRHYLTFPVLDIGDAYPVCRDVSTNAVSSSVPGPGFCSPPDVLPSRSSLDRLRQSFASRSRHGDAFHQRRATSLEPCS